MDDDRAPPGAAAAAPAPAAGKRKATIPAAAASAQSAEKKSRTALPSAAAAAAATAAPPFHIQSGTTAATPTAPASAVAIMPTQSVASALRPALFPSFGSPPPVTVSLSTFDKQLPLALLLARWCASNDAMADLEQLPYSAAMQEYCFSQQPGRVLHSLCVLNGALKTVKESIQQDGMILLFTMLRIAAAAATAASAAAQQEQPAQADAASALPTTAIHAEAAAEATSEPKTVAVPLERLVCDWLQQMASWILGQIDRVQLGQQLLVHIIIDAATGAGSFGGAPLKVAFEAHQRSSLLELSDVFTAAQNIWAPEHCVMEDASVSRQVAQLYFYPLVDSTRFAAFVLASMFHVHGAANPRGFATWLGNQFALFQPTHSYMRAIYHQRELELNLDRDQQTAGHVAVSDEEASPTIIRAGPGSGKTSLIQGMLHYLRAHGVRSEDIKLISMSNAGAKEMKQRQEKMSSWDSSQPLRWASHASVIEGRTNYLFLVDTFELTSRQLHAQGALPFKSRFRTLSLQFDPLKLWSQETKKAVAEAVDLFREQLERVATIALPSPCLEALNQIAAVGNEFKQHISQAFQRAGASAAGFFAHSPLAMKAAFEQEQKSFQDDALKMLQAAATANKNEALSKQTRSLFLSFLANHVVLTQGKWAHTIAIQQWTLQLLRHCVAQSVVPAPSSASAFAPAPRSIHSEVLHSLRRQWLIMDEAQDQSELDLTIAVEFAKFSGRVVMVGDPRQTIFAFTGADPARLREHAPARLTVERGGTLRSCNVRLLNTSYRSSQAILDVASALYPTEPKLLAHAGFPLGCNFTPRLTTVRNPPDAHEAAVHCVARWYQMGIPVHEIGVLVQTNLQAGSVVQKLNNIGIRAEPSAQRGGVPAVLVTTVHKAKGKEWTAVCVAGVDSKWCPNGRPQLQHDEKVCVLYVALSRAKVHLHVVTAGPPISVIQKQLTPNGTLWDVLTPVEQPLADAAAMVQTRDSAGATVSSRAEAESDLFEPVSEPCAPTCDEQAEMELAACEVAGTHAVRASSLAAYFSTAQCPRRAARDATKPIPELPAQRQHVVGLEADANEATPMDTGSQDAESSPTAAAAPAAAQSALSESFFRRNGEQWECELIALLRQSRTVHVGARHPKYGTHEFSARDTISLLTGQPQTNGQVICLQAGDYIYQPSFTPTALAGVRALALPWCAGNGPRIQLSTLKPDLLRVVSITSHHVELEVLDAKSSAEAAAEHRLQVAIYIAVLQELVAAGSTAELATEASRFNVSISIRGVGFIWTRHCPESNLPRVTAAPVITSLRHHFRSAHFRDTFVQPPAFSFFHLGAWCHKCNYRPDCEREALATSDVSLVNGVTPALKRSMLMEHRLRKVKSKSLPDIEDLAAALQQACEPAAPVAYEAARMAVATPFTSLIAELRARRPQLMQRAVHAIRQSRRVVPSLQPSFRMPGEEQVQVLVSLMRCPRFPPGDDLAFVSLQCASVFSDPLLGLPYTWIRHPTSAAPIASQFAPLVVNLHRMLVSLSERSLSVQFYTYSAREYRAFLQILLGVSLASESDMALVAEQASQLLATMFPADVELLLAGAQLQSAGPDSGADIDQSQPSCTSLIELDREIGKLFVFDQPRTHVLAHDLRALADVPNDDAESDSALLVEFLRVYEEKTTDTLLRKQIDARVTRMSRLVKCIRDQLMCVQELPNPGGFSSAVFLSRSLPPFTFRAAVPLRDYFLSKLAAMVQLEENMRALLTEHERQGCVLGAAVTIRIKRVTRADAFLAEFLDAQSRTTRKCITSAADGFASEFLMLPFNLAHRAQLDAELVAETGAPSASATAQQRDRFDNFSALLHAPCDLAQFIPSTRTALARVRLPIQTTNVNKADYFFTVIDRQAHQEFQQQERFMLFPLHRGNNHARFIAALHSTEAHLSAADPCSLPVLPSLLRDGAQWSQEQSHAWPPRAEWPQLNARQEPLVAQALDRLADGGLTLVHGPPGCGKTRLTARTLVHLLQIFRQMRHPMHIVVTAQSKSAIRLLQQEFVRQAEEFEQEEGKHAAESTMGDDATAGDTEGVAIAGSSALPSISSCWRGLAFSADQDGVPPWSVLKVDNSSVGDFISNFSQSILFGTVYQLHDVRQASHRTHVVVVEEASLMPIHMVALALQLLDDGQREVQAAAQPTQRTRRLMLIGDHLQLKPMWHLPRPLLPKLSAANMEVVMRSQRSITRACGSEACDTSSADMACMCKQCNLYYCNETCFKASHHKAAKKAHTMETCLQAAAPTSAASSSDVIKAYRTSPANLWDSLFEFLLHTVDAATAQPLCKQNDTQQQSAGHAMHADAADHDMQATAAAGSGVDAAEACAATAALPAPVSASAGPVGRLIQLHECYRMNDDLLAILTSTAYKNLTVPLRSVPRDRFGQSGALAALDAVKVQEQLKRVSGLNLEHPVYRAIESALDPNIPITVLLLRSEGNPRRTALSVSDDVREAQLAAHLAHALLECMPSVQASSASPLFVLTATHERRVLVDQQLRVISSATPFGAPRIVRTIDDAQGSQSSVVLLSLGCHDAVQLAQSAAHFFSPERINVAMSRAQHKLVLLLAEEQMHSLATLSIQPVAATSSNPVHDGESAAEDSPLQQGQAMLRKAAELANMRQALHKLSLADMRFLPGVRQ